MKPGSGPASPSIVPAKRDALVMPASAPSTNCMLAHDPEAGADIGGINCVVLRYDDAEAARRVRSISTTSRRSPQRVMSYLRRMLDALRPALAEDLARGRRTLIFLEQNDLPARRRRLLCQRTPPMPASTSSTGSTSGPAWARASSISCPARPVGRAGARPRLAYTLLGRPWPPFRQPFSPTTSSASSPSRYGRGSHHATAPWPGAIARPARPPPGAQIPARPPAPRPSARAKTA